MPAPRGRPEAIVSPLAARGRLEVQRLAPSTALAPFVEYLWIVRWSARPAFRQQVVPQPRIQLAAEHGRLLVHGVSRDPFVRELAGDGHTLGAAFHYGAFRPWIDAGVDRISGRVVPAGELFGIDDAPTARCILATGDAAAMADALDEYLCRRLPEPDPRSAEVAALLRYAERTPGLTRADALAGHAGVGLRALERRFAEYVGIGPKWVIRRFRLLDAARAVAEAHDIDWAALADRLGFHDQAHLTRAFTKVIGRSPAAYARDPGTRITGPAGRD